MNAIFYELDTKQVLGLTVYSEAGGEITEGKIAVATVVMERVDHRNWDGKTIIEVCFKKRQFSCYNEFDKSYGKTLHIAEAWDSSLATDFALMDCYSIAIGMIEGYIPRHPIIAAAHCCQYLTTAGKKDADWWKAMDFLVKIGGHEFYKERKAT
jgi:spore germination cell wall hydrolase CwlJ-like protein